MIEFNGFDLDADGQPGADPAVADDAPGVGGDPLDDPAVVAGLDLPVDGAPFQFDVTPEPEAAVELAPVPESDLVVDGQLVGDPVGDAEHWFEQAVSGFCVPASIAQIVSEYTGTHHADEQHFVQQANELNVFEVGPDGVPGIGIDGALTLLEDAGIPASIEYGDGVETLVEYLDEGRRVLLAVDSGEIWAGEATEDNAPDHAIVATGVDLDRGVVIVSDPGDPEGNLKEYPIDVFEDAWADSGYAAVVCDVTPEEFAATAPDLPADAADAAPADGQAVPVAAGALDVEATLHESPVEAAVGWTLQHPWIVLPVLLGAGALARSRK